jgi:hypothetical protein
MRTRLEAILIAIFIAITIITVGPSLTAQAAVMSPGNAALNWAETQAGKPYVYGADGPYGYDCSGLVYQAFLREGIDIGRDTFDQLATMGNGHFVPVPYGQEQRGDIAFYGDGHEEIVTDWHNQTFGAHDTGTLVSYIEWSSYWYPTMFFRVELNKARRELPYPPGPGGALVSPRLALSVDRPNPVRQAVASPVSETP